MVVERRAIFFTESVRSLFVSDLYVTLVRLCVYRYLNFLWRGKKNIKTNLFYGFVTTDISVPTFLALLFVLSNKKNKKKHVQ